MKRRHFIAASMLPLVASAVGAREPIVRSGESRFRYAIAAYSFREYFSFMRGNAQKPKADGPAMNMFQFIDYCVAQGADAAELTSYFFDGDADEGYLRELKQHAFLSGIAISGTAIGNDFTVKDAKALRSQIESTNQWIKKAAVLGAPHIRIFAGTAAQLGESKERMDAICDAVNECAKVAADHGVFLGVENHGGINAKQLLEVMSRVDSNWVGINLDTGNFVSDDPYQEMQMCSPFAVNVQFKPSLRNSAGKTYPADFSRVAQILKDSKYQGFVALEFEEGKPYERVPSLFGEMKAAFA